VSCAGLADRLAGCGAGTVERSAGPRRGAGALAGCQTEDEERGREQARSMERRIVVTS
jgi:hypothetical protein